MDLLLYPEELKKMHEKVAGLFEQLIRAAGEAKAEGGGEKNFNLAKVIEGELDDVITALIELDKQVRLENL